MAKNSLSTSRVWECIPGGEDDATFDACNGRRRRYPRLRGWMRVGSTSAAAALWEIDRRGDNKRRIGV
jgi:hypothetical protein